jgi:DNA-directed RNA polymerase specialized sigma24 family protein
VRAPDLIDELYDASYGRLVVQMLALCGSQGDAEDAVQEAFAQVVRRLAVKVPGPQQELDLGPDHVALVAALQRLDRTSREVVVLHHLADLSVEEIARQLDMAEGTVKSRLSRGRARLSELLTDALDDEEAQSRG